MSKQTKEILTRDLIEKKLRSYNKADIRASATRLACIAPFCILFLAIFLGLTLSLADGWVTALLFGILFGLLYLAPVLAFAYVLFAALAEKKLLDQGAFDISLYTVAYKSEITKRRHTVKTLHFVGSDMAVAVDNTTYQMAAEGDTFYLVSYRFKKPRVKLTYASKTCEYVE